MFLAVLIGLAILGFEVWMFVDAVKSPRFTDGQRLLWCLGMLLLHPFVAIAYYIVEYRRNGS